MLGVLSLPPSTRASSLVYCACSSLGCLFTRVSTCWLLRTSTCTCAYCVCLVSPVYCWYVNNAGFLRVFLYSDHGLTAPSLVLLFFLASFPGTACESTFYYINGCGYVVLQVEIREVTYYICRSSITDEI